MNSEECILYLLRHYGTVVPKDVIEILPDRYDLGISKNEFRIILDKLISSGQIEVTYSHGSLI